MRIDPAADAARRFGFAFEHAAVGMAAVGLDGRYIRVNETFCAVVGRTAKEVLELTWTDITVPDDVPAGDSARRQLLEDRTSARSIEKRYIRPDGTIVWVLVFFDLVRDEHYEPLYFFTQVIDITELRRLRDRELEATRERLAEAQEIARLGSWEWDARRDVQTWSDETYHQFGLRRGEHVVTFADFLERIHPDDRHLVLQDPALQQFGPFEFALRIVRPDGSLRWVQVRGRVIGEDGEVARIIGTSFDITERKLAEQAIFQALERQEEAVGRLQDLDRSKEAFLTAVSHELRTPLTSILGFVELLETRGERLTEDQHRELLRRTSRSARHLERLLVDLLDVDRLAKGVLEPRRQLADVGILVTNALSRSPLTDTRIVSTSIDHVMAEIDVGWIERIVDNLLSNVAKHVPKGTWVAVRVLSAGHSVAIEVEDDGPGIIEELRSLIFQPFGQGPTPEHAPGIGLGLTLVRQLAELQGGSVSVERGSRGGALLRVLLPRLWV